MSHRGAEGGEAQDDSGEEGPGHLQAGAAGPRLRGPGDAGQAEPDRQGAGADRAGQDPGKERDPEGGRPAGAGRQGPDEMFERHGATTGGPGV